MMLFLRKKRCPNFLANKVRHWVHYTHSAKAEEEERSSILQSLPPHLGEQLALHLNEGVIARIPIFSSIQSAHRNNFFASILFSSIWEMYGPG